MSYQVLARKWRPKSFTEMVGQEHVLTALSNALSQGRLHHAWLLTGTRGVGKTTLARIMAKALNCEQGVSATPCGQCRTCQEIDGGRFVDLIEMDAASNTKVDDMREILDNAQYLPTAGRYKVYLIDEVHMLSRSAFNSMLKTLEEPPEHVKFILATTDPQKIPVTVLSRCLQFSLRQITPGEIAGHLEDVLGREGIACEPAALRLVARAARGSMRDALSLLDQAIAYGGGAVGEQTVRGMLGAIDTGWLYDLLETLAAGDGAALMEQVQAIAARSLSFESALQEMAVLLHQVALAQVVPQSVPADAPDRERLLRLAQTLPADAVQLYYQIALNGRRDLPLAPDEETGFAMTLLRMLAFGVDGQAPEAAQPTGRPSAAAARPAAPAAEPQSRTRSAQEALARAQEQRQAPPVRLAEPPREAPPPDVPPAPRQAAPLREVFDGDWVLLVGRLGLGGVPKQLAQHCVLESFDAGHINLRVAPEYKNFLGKNYQDRLVAAVHAHIAGDPVVTISVGQGGGLSAAKVKQEENAAEQRKAEESIARDPFVRQLQQECSAQVVEASIRAKR